MTYVDIFINITITLISIAMVAVPCYFLGYQTAEHKAEQKRNADIITEDDKRSEESRKDIDE